MLIDQLIVKLVLDATGFTKGQKDATDALDKTKEQAVKSSKAIEASALSASQGVEKLGRQFLGLFALLAGAQGVKQFLSDLTTTDAALGRTAKNIDMSGKALSTWQGVAVAAGGSAEGITGSMASLSNAMQEAALTGQNRLAPVFRALGINLATTSGKARDVGDIMFDLNKKAQGMDPARFATMMRMVGIDDGTISLLEKSTTEFRKLYAEQQKYAATASDIEAAQRRQTGWRELSLTVVSLGRTIATSLTPIMLSAMRAVQTWADANQEWLKTEIVAKVREFVGWLQRLDWKAIGEGARDFVGKVREIAGAIDEAVKNIDGQSPIFKAFEAFGALLLGAQVLGAIGRVMGALTALGRLPVPAVLLNPAIVGAGAIALGASAESTPGAGVPADPTERAKVAAENKRLTDEANAKQGYTGSLLGDTWKYLKNKMGFGGQSDDPKTRDALSDTAKATTETRDILKRQADAAAGGADGGGGGAPTVLQTARRALGWAASAGGNSPRKGVVGNFGEAGWWTPDRQSHAIDVLMKEGGLTEDGAKALVARWKFVESPGGPNAVNPRSGAAGIAQGLGSRKSGYTGSFDDQLKNAARELNGAEGRAKRMLNTPGQEAAGASQFERAEGYNAATGEDNFTARTREGMKHIVHGGATGAGAATPSAKAQSAADAFKAKLRALNGGKTSALGYHRTLMAGVMAHHSAHTVNHNDNSSETKIGSIAVHTQATDARGIAEDLRPYLFQGRDARQANRGLA